jgi:hypothetical protein
VETEESNADVQISQGREADLAIIKYIILTRIGKFQ